MGEAHSLALDQAGTLFSFGWGQLGQLGISKQKAEAGAFMINQVGFLSQIGLKKVVAGANFSAGLTQDGRLYVWGSGLNGQLGLGS